MYRVKTINYNSPEYYEIYYTLVQLIVKVNKSEMISIANSRKLKISIRNINY